MMLVLGFISIYLLFVKAGCDTLFQHASTALQRIFSIWKRNATRFQRLEKFLIAQNASCCDFKGSKRGRIAVDALLKLRVTTSLQPTFNLQCCPVFVPQIAGMGELPPETMNWNLFQQQQIEKSQARPCKQ